MTGLNNQKLIEVLIKCSNAKASHSAYINYNYEPNRRRMHKHLKFQFFFRINQFHHHISISQICERDNSKQKYDKL